MQKNLLKTLLILVLSVISALSGMAQRADKYQRIANKIDSLADIGLPKSALLEVDKLDKLARLEKNTSQQVKAVIYRMNFQSHIEEQALEAIIKRLKQDIGQSAYPVKPVLESLLADFYFKYYQQNRYKFYQRTTLEKPDADFTRWDLQTLINEVSRLYQRSLKEAQLQKNTSIAVLDGVLVGDSASRIFRPTLYDFLAHRALDFYLTEEPDLLKPKMPFSLKSADFFAENTVFVNTPVKTDDTSSISYQGIKLLKELTAIHLSDKNIDPLADINLRRLEYVFRKSVHPEKDSLYVRGLLKLMETFSQSPVAGDAGVKVAQYFQQKDSLKIARTHLDYVVKTYPKTLASENAGNLIKQLEAKSLQITIENVNIPDKPVLVLVSYANITELNYKVFKLSDSQLKAIHKLGNPGNRWRNGAIQPTDSLLIYLNKQKTIKEVNTGLAITDDFKAHHSEIALESLGPGNYILLSKDAQSNELSTTNIVQFKVSNLAFSSRIIPSGFVDIRTLNRETGEPLPNVEVMIIENRHDGKKWNEVVLGKGLSNAKGEFRSDSRKSGSQFSIRLNFNNDFYRHDDMHMYGTTDMGHVEMDIDRTVLFTDRQIYRPGQTVYFKGIQLIQSGAKSRIAVNKSVEVSLNDANGKKVSSMNFTTNEFGTFAGTFILPQNTLNGYFHLSGLYGSAPIRVEEYKRPTFQVELDPVKESYKLSDSVKVTGVVTAFSGYGISNGKVAYRITCQFNSRDYRYRYRSNSAEILSDTINTNSSGEFAIKFKAIAEDRNYKIDDVFNFQITADVLDGSGETRSATTTVVVGDKAMLVNFPLPGRLLAINDDNAFQIPVQINNLNNQHLNGSMKIRIYSLTPAGQVFVKRLWNSPDKPLMSREDFRKLFPYSEYDNEGNFKNWKRDELVIESDLTVLANAVNYVDLLALKKQISGTYEIEVFSKNVKGDTSRSKLYTTLIAEPSFPDKIEDWVVPLKTTVLPGENAEFYVGLGKGFNILMETYDGPRLLTSEWIKSGAKQQLIKVPFKLGSTNFSVQFLTVFQNRLMSSYHKIDFKAVDNKLDVRFLTFRDKLQPGSKEQWKLQIKGSDTQAEMVASLYDSSLDHVAEPQSWLNTLNNSYRYQPSYYNWLENFVSPIASRPFEYRNDFYVLDYRRYETLDMLGVRYLGNYNNYLSRIAGKGRSVIDDEKLKKNYYKNAVLVKNGFDVSGKVKDQSGEVLPGAIVQIKGTKISTLTNSKGYFKLKVPKKAILRCSYIGFTTKEIIAQSPIINVILASENVLNNVVVTGYGTQQKRDLSGSVSTVSEQAIRSVPMTSADQTMQGRAAGVQVQMSNAVPVIRKNFNETAFFYPQLRTNSKGEILIEFTIPEALTNWRFRGFAHTKNLQAGYIEKTIVTQKSLMISANMPRFFREGDSITISARLANLSDKKLTGKIELQLFDALTMKPVNLFAESANANQNFSLASATNKAVSFRLIIPKGLDAITYRLTADAGEFSDGEENTIPVLPNSMLVTESVPMMVRAGQTKTFSIDKLKNVSSTTLINKTLTLEYTQNPVWYAVQSLPYLMEYPYECSEQTFSRFFSNSLASTIVNRMPQIKKVFDLWKMSNSNQLLSNLDKNQELKSILVEETPWLQNALSETEQKKRIALLFDLNKMSNELEADISKLGKMQRHDGGFPWFTGSNYSDRYITQHILGGLGQLAKLTDLKPVGSSNTIAAKALTYLDNEIIKDYKHALKQEKKRELNHLSPVTLHALYVRSFYPAHKLSTDLKVAITYFMPKISSGWKFKSVYEQGLSAFILKRSNQPEGAKAIIRSLKETAQQSEELGMYWAKNQIGYYWYQSPIETQALMIELFSEIGNEQASVEEMKIWLLRNKQTNNWRTTKATALACHALLLQGNNSLDATGETEISIGGQALTLLKPEVRADAGTGYLKTSWSNEQITPDLATVKINNKGKSISWGALHWQYLEELNKITPAETQLKLERKYFIQKQSDAGPRLTEINNSNLPKTGDVLKVVVYLNADRDYEYVQLKDMRPSGTEPVDILSGYKYQDRMYYYQVTKDVATNFFINYLPKGKYVFEYNLRVAQPGNYSTGISSIQCLYAPEFNAHSEGQRMTIK